MRGPFASVEHEAILSVLRTSDWLENRVARFWEYGLQFSQYDLLRKLRVAGKPGRPFANVSPRDLKTLIRMLGSVRQPSEEWLF